MTKHPMKGCFHIFIVAEHLYKKASHAGEEKNVWESREGEVKESEEE